MAKKDLSFVEKKKISPQYYDRSRIFLNVFRDSYFYRIFYENKSSFTFPLDTWYRNIFEKKKLETIKVETLRFKLKLSRLLYGYFLQSYNSSKYRHFFIIMCSVMLSIVYRVISALCSITCCWMKWNSRKFAIWVRIGNSITSILVLIAILRASGKIYRSVQINRPNCAKFAQVFINCENLSSWISLQKV